MNKNNKVRGVLLAAGLAVAAACAHAQPQSTTLTRAADLRADKLAVSPVIAPLAVGTRVRALSVEGGWVWVETETPPTRRGWVRARRWWPMNASACR